MYEFYFIVYKDPKVHQELYWSYLKSAAIKIPPNHLHSEQHMTACAPLLVTLLTLKAQWVF